MIKDLSEPLFNWIQGERRAPVAGSYLSWTDPLSDEAAPRVPDSDFMDVVAAVRASNQVAQEWARKDFASRASLVEKWADLIVADADELARLSAVETGQRMADARESDILRAAEAMRVAARLARSTDVHRLPGGLSGLITTWSEPVFHLARKLAPAILGGGPAIVKPSSLAGSAILRFVEWSKTAGLPDGVVNVVCGSGTSAGEALIAHPAIGSITFTGSSDVGGRVRRLAAEHDKRLHSGLGGRNAVVVYADTDLGAYIPVLARVLFDFHHETAWRGSRVFVQETGYKPFLEALAAEVGKWRLGDPLDPVTDLGPMPGPRRYESYAAARAQAEAEKGKPLVMTGTTERARRSGSFATPYASMDLTLCSTLQQREIPGPFVSLSTFKYLHDAAKHANNSPLGQAAYVFGADRGKTVKTAEKIEAGRVFVNSGPVRDLDLEAAPLKGSGFGGDGPRALLDYFSRPTAIRVDGER